MKEYFCITFLSGKPETATQADRNKFERSLKQMHEDGFYLVYSKKNDKWRASNKNPEKLRVQKETVGLLMGTLFTEDGTMRRTQ